jgi:hypothetical protein
VLSRIIRNRLVARTLGWLAWISAALVILGVGNEAAAWWPAPSHSPPREVYPARLPRWVNRVDFAISAVDPV